MSGKPTNDQSSNAAGQVQQGVTRRFYVACLIRKGNHFDVIQNGVNAVNGAAARGKAVVETLNSHPGYAGVNMATLEEDRAT